MLEYIWLFDGIKVELVVAKDGAWWKVIRVDSEIQDGVTWWHGREHGLVEVFQAAGSQAEALAAARTYLADRYGLIMVEV